MRETTQPIADDGDRDTDLSRRLTYLMAFRVLLITLVMGATTLLYWLGDVDLTQPNSLILYGVIGSTYLLTLVYARRIGTSQNHKTLAIWQISIDLAIATVIVHVTGGAQSAYTFFYPLAVIASAVLRSRKGTIIFALAAMVLFLSVSYLGWTSILPVPTGQPHIPTVLSPLDFGRAIALNLAAIAGIGAMSVQLAAQLQKSSADLEVHRSAAADLLTLHEDIVNCLTSGLITVDEEGRILTVNQTASEILSCNVEDSLGLPLSQCSEALDTFLKAHPLEAEARRGEVIHPTSDGSETFLGVSISPLFDHKSHPVGRIVNFQDLTEVKLLEQNIKRTERLTVIGTLAAGIAHEIRNPLASISGSIELLGSAPSSDEDSEALMNIVTREIERLNSLITELLEYANPRPARFSTFDLAEVISDTLRVFAQNANFADINVKFSNAEKQPLMISADPEKIRQMLWNLLCNGAEAALSGGCHLWVTVASDDEALIIEFRNDGPRIPPDILEKIFDPFFTTKAKGTGLGLATVHGTVMDHGGTISVTSDSDVGVSFKVQLPTNKT